MSNFSPATSTQQVMSFDDYQVVPAICYEITYPGIIHDLIANADANSDKAKLLVTVSNDAWFGDSFGPYQHMQMARMRALELGIPLVRSTNDGISAVVDARGNMISKLERYTQDTLAYEIALLSYQTLYRQYGLLGIYLILAMSLLVFSVRWLSRK
jgi:apolipoprotein N-acyltransferase